MMFVTSAGGGSEQLSRYQGLSVGGEKARGRHHPGWRITRQTNTAILSEDKNLARRRTAILHDTEAVIDYVQADYHLVCYNLGLLGEFFYSIGLGRLFLPEASYRTLKDVKETLRFVKKLP
jgi:hypothetical protein